MAFDEDLADRIRDVLGPRAGLAEKRMFSGLAFLLDGNMCCAVTSRGLMLRVGPEAYPAALTHDGVGPFEMRGRPMTGWVLVEPEVIADTDGMLEWLDQAIRFTTSLPPGGGPKKNRRGTATGTR